MSLISSLLPIRVLVVDDDYDECEIIRRAFEIADDIEVCGIVNDGVAGVEMTKKLMPDVILLDIIMPNIDGLEVAKKIRELDMEKDPKIIMFTAIGNQNVINTAFGIGVDYYLKKPVNLLSLIEKVRMVHKNKAYTDMYNINKSNFRVIKETINKICIPINLTGYKYIVQVVDIMLEKNNMTFKQMYEIVAEKNNTSSQCVEVSVRNAIRRATEIQSDFYKSIFDSNGGKIQTNSVFFEKIKEVVYMNLP